jgi:hypothetical protein
MRKIVVLSILALLGTAYASEALAKKDKGQKGPQAFCQFRPTGEWMPIQQITDKAKALGYDVWKVDQKRGCWEIHGYDKNGANIRVSFDPGTGQLVSARPRF